MYWREAFSYTWSTLRFLVLLKCPSCGRKHYIHAIHKYRGESELHCYYGWVFGVRTLIPNFILHLRRGIQ